MTTIALLGAAGNMGTRVWRAIKDDGDYQLLCVEEGEPGRKKLRERGIEATPADQAVPIADVALLAVPDSLIGRVSAAVVPKMRPGAILMMLDPAAAHAGVIPPRGDISIFVTHPAHPPVFNDEMDMDARRDYFGSGLAKQAIVSALGQGPEGDYAVGEALSRKIFAPILRSHRVTVEQMAILEPPLSETVGATCIAIIKEATDEAVRRGVPAEAAKDFILGHINIALAIIFKEIDWDFSAGARQAIEEAKPVLFQPDWKRVFEPEAVKASVRRIAGGGGEAGA